MRFRIGFLLLLTLASIVVLRAGWSYSVSGLMDIGPGEAGTIFCSVEKQAVEVYGRPSPQLPDVALEAIDRCPDWLREKLKETFRLLMYEDLKVKSYSRASVGDLDGDGLPDILVGSIEGILYCYQNLGVLGSPLWVSREAWVRGVRVESFSSPCLVDLNHDGLLDLAVCSGNGNVRFWFHVEGEQPGWVEASWMFQGIRVAEKSSIAFIDLDGDGLEDMIVGTDNGLRCYLNTGDPSIPAWTPANWIVSGLNTGNWTYPSACRINGRVHLFVGLQDGTVKVYRLNIEGEALRHKELPGGGIWTDTGMLYWVDVGYHAAPCPADLDGDGRLDLILGSSDGYLYLLKGYGTREEPVFPHWVEYTELNYYPSIERLTVAGKHNRAYVEEYASLLLSVEDKYLDEVAYCIANEQPSNLKILADRNSTQIYRRIAESIYRVEPKLGYVKLVELPGMTTLAFNNGDGWTTIPPEVYYQRLVMPNRYILFPWRWPGDYDGNLPWEYLPWDETYGVSLYSRVKDARTPTEAMWRLACWLKNDVKAYYHSGIHGKPPGWYMIYNHLTDKDYTIYCGEFSIITMVAGRSILIPVANTLNLGDDHQWDEFYNEEGRWVHIDLSATQPGDLDALRDYFDNPRVYEEKWHSQVSAVMWLEQAGRYDHLQPRTRQMGYSRTATLKFHVSDARGRPVDGARVEAWTMRGAPALLNYTDAYGWASLELGGKEYVIRIVTRLGIREYSLNVEEDETYIFNVRLEGELPSTIGRPTAKHYRPREPCYTISLKARIVEARLENPHWGRRFAERMGYKDYWILPQADLEVYVLDRLNYERYISGESFKTYYAFTLTGKLSVKLVFPRDLDVYIVFSNTRLQDTTVTLEYSVEVSDG